MVNDKMCVGVETERLMIRLDPVIYEEVVHKEGCHPMDFTGKIMKGFVLVDSAVVNSNDKLAYGIGLALDYNKIAKPSRKRE